MSHAVPGPSSRFTDAAQFVLDAGDAVSEREVAILPACPANPISFAAMPWPRPLREALQPCPEYPQVRVVRDYVALRRVGRLRHQQFISVQRKAYRSAVLDPNCLLELSDLSGVNIYAAEGDKLTAAMRIALLSDENHPAAPLFAEVASRNRVEAALTLICTRLVRNPEYNGRHAGDLVRFVRLQAVTAGYRYCIMQTAERLVPYFRRFQFFPTDHVVEDEAAGALVTMILDTRFRPVQGHKEAADGAL